MGALDTLEKNKKFSVAFLGWLKEGSRYYTYIYTYGLDVGT
jgi:hypothetical protein